MVLESKPIPLYSGVYHIEFATMMGVTVLLLLRGLIINQFRDSFLVAIAALVLVICMHILGSRTGLVLVYVGAALMLAQWAYHKPKYRAKVLWILPCLMLGLFLVPSARNRIVNTWVDMKTTWTGGDVTHQSFGQRWIAWKSSASVLGTSVKHAVIGSGAWADDRLQKEYARLDVALAERHRIGVHNQWLEWSLQSGWLSATLFFVFVFLALKENRNSLFQTNQYIWLALVSAMMFESLLERQAGILIVIVAWQVMLGTEIVNNSQIKDDNTLNH